ncbi:MAG: hypothetical protein MI923_10255 [Phycisphaerales bacterium]|nr:hypothetical protein [Phycisphaerales bacterium]
MTVRSSVKGDQHYVGYAQRTAKRSVHLHEPYGFPAANIRFIENIPATMQAWMAHLAREMLRLGVFFQAATVMAQVPGAHDYKYIMYNDDDDDVPDAVYGTLDRLSRQSPDLIYTILVECLKRLEAEHVVKTLPIVGRRCIRLSAEWVTFLDAQEVHWHAYENVVAECLSMLIVKPGMEEINRQGKTTWWQQCWAMEAREE